MNDNIDIRKQKDIKYYAARKQKGHETYGFQEGMQVMRRNPRKLGRKGDRLQPDWMDGYEISTIAGHHAKLHNTRTGKVLKAVHLKHLKPHKTRQRDSTAHMTTYQGDHFTVSQTTPMDVGADDNEKSLPQSPASDLLSLDSPPATPDVQGRSLPSAESDLPSLDSKPAQCCSAAARDVSLSVLEDTYLASLDSLMREENAVVSKDSEVVREPSVVGESPIDTPRSSPLPFDMLCDFVPAKGSQLKQPCTSTPKKSQHQKTMRSSSIHGETGSKQVFSPPCVKKMNRRMTLPQEQLDILNSSSRWLTDDIVDYTQSLLSQQFREIDSLQSVCLLEAGAGQTPLGSPTRPWVQVVWVGQCHWITVSSLRTSRRNAVQIYDSMYSVSASKKLICQLSVLSFKFTEDDELIIEHQNMQRQQGGNDCGLFAVAVATALCHDIDPLTCRFHQSRMREHLRLCLTKGRMEPFPAAERRVGFTTKAIEHTKLYCLCRSPDSVGLMIECNKCNRWYHESCVKPEPEVLNNHAHPYYCPLCCQT